MPRFVTFGEIMLRLKPPGAERFFQSPLLEATFGGGEANVATALARFGCETSYVSVIPANAIGDACVGELHGTASTPRGSCARARGWASISSRQAQTSGRKWSSTTGQGPPSLKRTRGTSTGKRFFQARHGSTSRDHARHLPVRRGPLPGGRARGEAAGPDGVLRSELPQEPLEVRKRRARGDDGARETRRCRHRQ